MINNLLQAIIESRKSNYFMKLKIKYQIDKNVYPVK